MKSKFEKKYKKKYKLTKDDKMYFYSRQRDCQRISKKYQEDLDNHRVVTNMDDYIENEAKLRAFEKHAKRKKMIERIFPKSATKLASYFLTRALILAIIIMIGVVLFGINIAISTLIFGSAPQWADMNAGHWTISIILLLIEAYFAIAFYINR